MKVSEVGVELLHNAVYYSVLTELFSQCRLPLISVALVEGRALGGGAELTTACDFRYNSKCVYVVIHNSVQLYWHGC